MVAKRRPLHRQCQQAFSAKQRRALLHRITYGGKSGLFDDYAAAEQAAFAVKLLLRELNPKRFSQIIGTLYKSLADEDESDIYRFRNPIGEALN